MSLHRLLQTNLNHSATAQDLFVQHLAEWGIGLAVAAEPYLIPSRPNWLGDLSGLVLWEEVAMGLSPSRFW